MKTWDRAKEKRKRKEKKSEAKIGLDVGPPGRHASPLSLLRRGQKFEGSQPFNPINSAGLGGEERSRDRLKRAK